MAEQPEGRQLDSTPFGQLTVHALMDEIRLISNPHLTYSTLVLRLAKRLVASCNVSWDSLIEMAKDYPVDPELHDSLEALWNARTRPVTLDEQHCVERILGRDYVRPTDLLKLAGCMSKFADQHDVWTWFAVDGFLGDDPKRYVDAFKYGPNDLKGKHTRAVRKFYKDKNSMCEHDHSSNDISPSLMKGELTDIYDGFEQGPYVEMVGGMEAVAQLAEWRREQAEKMRKKQDDPSTKKRKAEEEAAVKSEEGAAPVAEEGMP